MLRNSKFNAILVSSTYILCFICANLNLNLFSESQDFDANIFWLEIGGVLSLTKGVVFIIYGYVFSKFVNPTMFLLSLWSVIPASLVILYLKVIDCISYFSFGLRKIFKVFGSVFVCYFIFFRFVFDTLSVPTGHLLFQSVASALIPVAFFCYQSSRSKSLFIFATCIFLHYSSIMYIFFGIVCIKNFKYNKFYPLVTLKKSALMSLLITICGYTLGLIVFVKASFLLRGYDESDAMGVADDLTSVIYINLLLSFVFVVVNFMRNLIENNKIKVESAYFVKIRFLASYLLTVSLLSIILSKYNLGLGYRLNYAAYVLSSLVSLIIVTQLFILIVKVSRGGLIYGRYGTSKS